MHCFNAILSGMIDDDVCVPHVMVFMYQTFAIYQLTVSYSGWYVSKLLIT